jgi:pimeloyl-ACP methyl ester carboxylesterase
VFVHGIGMSHRSFGRIARVLRASHPLVAVDLPGFGDARSPHRSVGVEGQAAAVAAGLRSLGIDDCVVVGHSMGTQVAVELARMHPDLVSSVVLIGPVIDDRRPSLGRQVATLIWDTVRERPSINAIAASDYVSSVPQVLRELRPMLDYPLLARVGELSVPVLVLRGDRDPIVRRDWALRVVAAAADGTFVETVGPHHVQQYAPVVVASVIRAFLSAQVREPRR